MPMSQGGKFPTHSATLDKILGTQPPRLLFHYTSPEGLIGIVKKKQVWATNAAYLNDAKEIEQAVDCARHSIENCLRTQQWPDDERQLLTDMHCHVGSAARRIYLFSISEERDLLSQWRAYCPPTGGYSVGFPSAQLLAVAAAQSFFLSPCVYDYQTQYQIVSEIIGAFLTLYRSSRSAGGKEQDVREKVRWEFAHHIARIGAVFKHASFQEEKEWRLISSPESEGHPQVDFRAGRAGVIPFFRLNLVDTSNPNLGKVGDVYTTVVIGPCRDPVSAQVAVQHLLQKYLGTGAHGMSSVPYRPW